MKKLFIVLLCAALGGCFTPENRVHPAVKDLEGPYQQPSAHNAP
jgi:hypothetical protein